MNLAGQTLTNAAFSGYEYCDELGCYTVPGANLTGANLSGADARGAYFYLATLTGANTSNLIQSNGHIAGLDLTAGASLVVRDYDGNSPYVSRGSADPVTSTSTLRWRRRDAAAGVRRRRLGFDDLLRAGHSRGTRRHAGVDLRAGVNIATQSGRTIDLFDWTGVTPTGAFTVSSPYTWNLSNLYTTGEITLAAAPSLPGDFNHDGTVDAADYVVWRKNRRHLHARTTTTHGAPTSANPAGSEFAVPQCECHRPRTDNVGDAHRGGGWLVCPARPGPRESTIKSLTRDTRSTTHRCDTRFLTHENCAGKRRRGAFETDLA